MAKTPAGFPALRVALVGYGSAGAGIHAPLIEAAEGLTVSHVVTSDPGRADAARTAHPDVTVHQSYDDLLASARGVIDLVVLASPNAVHAEQIRAAVGLRLPVVVDKPLAVTAVEARDVVELARTENVPLTVFQNRRWDASHRTLHRILASHSLGSVVRYEARFERWRPVPKTRWREQQSSEDGGGLLLDLQSHLVDQAVDLFGPVATVYAELASVTTPADDVTFLALTHDSGVRSHLGATSLAGAPGPRLRVLGTSGAYVVGGVDGEEAVTGSAFADEDTAQRGWLLAGEDRDVVRAAPAGWEAYYPAVVAWLRGDGPVPVKPADAVHVLAVLDAARASAAGGVVVRPADS